METLKEDSLSNHYTKISKRKSSMLSKLSIENRYAVFTILCHIANSDGMTNDENIILQDILLELEINVNEYNNSNMDGAQACDLLKNLNQDEKDEFSPEYIRTLEEALRIDYLEKWKIYAQLKVVQKSLGDTTAELKKVKRAYELVSDNLKRYEADMTEFKGRYKFEKEKSEKLAKSNKDFRAQIRSLKKEKEE